MLTVLHLLSVIIASWNMPFYHGPLSSEKCLRLCMTFCLAIFSLQLSLDLLLITIDSLTNTRWTINIVFSTDSIALLLICVYNFIHLPKSYTNTFKSSFRVFFITCRIYHSSQMLEKIYILFLAANLLRAYSFLWVNDKPYLPPVGWWIERIISLDFIGSRKGGCMYLKTKLITYCFLF